jgi:hypothetical protein
MMEREAIAGAMRYTQGNKSATARMLGISIRTLDARLELYESENKKQEIADDERKREAAGQLARERGANTPNNIVTADKLAEEKRLRDLADAQSTSSSQPVPPVSQKPAVSVSQRKKV